MSASAGVNYSILEYLSARNGPNLTKRGQTTIKSRPGEGLEDRGGVFLGDWWFETYKIWIISKLVEGQEASIFQMSSDSRVPEGKSDCLQS